MTTSELREMAGNLPAMCDEYTLRDIHIADQIVDQWLKEHPANEDDPLTQYGT